MKRITKHPFLLSRLLIVTLLWSIVSLSAVAQSGNNPFDIGGQNANSPQAPPVEVVPAPQPPDNPLDVQQDTTNKDTAPSPEVNEAAATGSNPFEQQANSNVVEENIEQNTATFPANTGNPFEVAPEVEKKDNIATPSSPTLPKKTTTKSTDAEQKLIDIDTNKSASSGFLFVLIVIMTVLFAVLLTLFRPYFGKAYQAYINDSQLRSAYREMGSSIELPYLILYGMFLINTGILTYVILQHYGISLGSNWFGILKIIGILCLVFISKHLLLTIVGNIFPIAKEIELYNFTIIVFNIMLGVFFVPLSLFLAYGPDNLIIGVLYLTFALILLTYLYRSIRGLLIGGKFISFHKFHFFMYLCTAELAPLALVIKLAMNQMQ